eukprot:6208022-Pleurochrysis_carterae.AAC.1
MLWCAVLLVNIVCSIRQNEVSQSLSKCVPVATACSNGRLQPSFKQRRFVNHVRIFRQSNCGSFSSIKLPRTPRLLVKPRILIYAVTDPPHPFRQSCVQAGVNYIREPSSTTHASIRQVRDSLRQLRMRAFVNDTREPSSTTHASLRQLCARGVGGAQEMRAPLRGASRRAAAARSCKSQ